MLQGVQIGSCLDYENAPEDYVIRICGTDKVSGLWSDQVNFWTIMEYVSLRAKLYCVKFADGECIIKNEDIINSSATITNTNTKINFDDCKRCLFENEHIYVEQYLIRSQSCTLYSTSQEKLALISEDKKKKVLKHRIMTLPHGYQAEKYNNE